MKGFGRGSTELGFPTANFSEEVMGLSLGWIFSRAVLDLHQYLLQVIEALPEALIGGIYWGLAQVDNGQVFDMVSGHFLSFTNHPKVD